MRTRRITRTALVLLVILLAGALTITTATAKDKAKDKSKGKRTHEKAQYMNKLPPMAFLNGHLTRNALGGWEMDGTTVWFGPASQLMDPMQPDIQAAPREGQQMKLMGYRVGDTFVVRQGIIERQRTGDVQQGQEAYVRWSLSDPSVGEGEGPQ
jgi:hypothetical protein